MTREEAQQLWDRFKSTTSERRDVVFEWITEDGWDVQDDVVIDPKERRKEE